MRKRIVWSLAIGSHALFSPLVPAQPRVTVDQKPKMDIAATTVSGEIVIEYPVGGARLSNGTIVIADLMAGALKFFSPTGQLVRTVGRRGSGPGEFMHPAWLGHCAPDSLFVWDLRLQRMSVITDAGITALRPDTARANLVASQPLTLACSRHGVFAYQPFARNSGPVRSMPGVVRGSAPVIIGRIHGTPNAMIDGVAAGELAVFGGGAGPRPLGKQTSLAVSANRLYVGTADSAFVSVFSHDGQLVGVVSVGGSARKPTQANFESAVNEIVSSIHGGNAETVRKGLLAVPIPDRMPPYNALFTDEDDRLWIVLSRGGDVETKLRVLSATGVDLGDVRIPMAITVFEIGRDYILAKYDANNGEPHVALFEIHIAR